MVVDSKSHLHGDCGAFKGKMVTIRVLGNVSAMVWCKIVRLAWITISTFVVSCRYAQAHWEIRDVLSESTDDLISNSTPIITR